MSIPRIKALTKRMRQRIGSTEDAARQAGLKNKGAWSLYESAERPRTSLPLHCFLAVANAAERAELIDLLLAEDEAEETCLLTASSEATEAAAGLQREVREALADGPLTEAERRKLRLSALGVKAEADDVLSIVGRAA